MQEFSSDKLYEYIVIDEQINYEIQDFFMDKKDVKTRESDELSEVKFE